MTTWAPTLLLSCRSTPIYKPSIMFDQVLEHLVAYSRCHTKITHQRLGRFNQQVPTVLEWGSGIDSDLHSWGVTYGIRKKAAKQKCKERESIGEFRTTVDKLVHLGHSTKLLGDAAKSLAFGATKSWTYPAGENDIQQRRGRQWLRSILKNKTCPSKLRCLVIYSFGTAFENSGK